MKHRVRALLALPDQFVNIKSLKAEVGALARREHFNERGTRGQVLLVTFILPQVLGEEDPYPEAAQVGQERDGSGRLDGQGGPHVTWLPVGIYQGGGVQRLEAVKRLRNGSVPGLSLIE
jgi:hypothetical protein